jgi:hypothetical protein
MNKPLQCKLFVKYPKIFSEVHLDITKSCMAQGITCGDGWYKLLDSLCMRIQTHINNPGTEPKKCISNILGERWNKFVWNPVLYPIFNKIFPYNVYQWCFNHLSYKTKFVYKKIPQLVAKQVKEKFGTLRFYYAGGDEYIRCLVDCAEELSMDVCETCGVNVCQDSTVKIKKGTRHFWLRNLCGKCRRKQRIKKND